MRTIEHQALLNKFHPLFLFICFFCHTRILSWITLFFRCFPSFPNRVLLFCSSGFLNCSHKVCMCKVLIVCLDSVCKSGFCWCKMDHIKDVVVTKYLSLQWPTHTENKSSVSLSALRSTDENCYIRVRYYYYYYLIIIIATT